MRMPNALNWRSDLQGQKNAMSSEGPGLPDIEQGLSRLERQWLVEAIRLREEQAGLLEDAEANRYARLTGTTLAQRIEYRALWLARRDGLRTALQHLRQSARLALLLMLLLSLLTGAGLAYAALGNGQQPVNIFQALFSLLGLNWLMLLIWLSGFLVRGDSASVLGRLWLWLSEKFARDARAAQLLPALLLLLQRERLGRWGLGLLSHGLWLLVQLAAMGVLVGLLSIRRYGFVWETTLLDSDTFVAFTQGVGALPSVFGFELPAIDLIRASGQSAVEAEAARQGWSIWLIGAVLVYGIMPRLLLFLLCFWRWQYGRARLALDPDQAAYVALREQLQPSSERLGIVDAAPADRHSSTGMEPIPAANGHGAVLVGIELDESQPWPPPGLAASIRNAGVVESREQRRLLLDELSLHPPERLLIACDPRRSPDRGTLALIDEMVRTAETAKIWLLSPPPGVAVDRAREEAWRHVLQERQLALGRVELLHWLETGSECAR